jgi:hypothetical protein
MARTGKRDHVASWARRRLGTEVSFLGLRASSTPGLSVNKRFGSGAKLAPKSETEQTKAADRALVNDPAAGISI